MNTAIRFEHITKTFGNVVANNDVTMDVMKGEILSLLGENGSGKTTLMNMLAGIYFPDSGEILINGVPVSIRSPKDAYDHHIGMIHQHFKLVDVFTAADNILLGETQKKFSIKNKALALKENVNTPYIVIEPENASAPVKYVVAGKYSAARFKCACKMVLLPFAKCANQIIFNHLKRNRARDIQVIVDKYGFDIDLNKKIYDMSVSEKQTVEIIKVLYRGAEILILDEPTAVLTPQEAEKLFQVIRNMRDDGKSIIIITHKLQEVLAVSDRVAVLRKGEYVGVVDTKDANELSLTEMMVGQKVELNIDRPEPKDTVKRLQIRNLTCKNHDGVGVLDNVSFDVYGGEILGIAGISGCGQKELLESVAGLQKTMDGSSVLFYDKNDKEGQQLIGKSPRRIRDLGVALSFVPEDRLGMGLVGSMGMTENMLLKTYNKGFSPFMSKKESRALAERIKQDLDVMTPSVNTAVRRLSGGNVQKVLVGREIANAPSVLMTAYAVRGLDINTSYTIYSLLNEQKQKGVAVVYVGEDLDVLLALSDKILVLCGGKVNGLLDARTTTKEQVGLLMTNLKEEARA